MRITEGVCCHCQSIRPVVPASLNHEEREELEEMEHGDEMNYVMAPHRILGDSGPECEGVGTMPQTVNIKFAALITGSRPHRG